ncbi:MAG: type II secretion system F family protein [Pirellulaceae bacterium]|nr:type II secretion system F family protein [Pirellulaceae bacterium]
MVAGFEIPMGLVAAVAVFVACGALAWLVLSFFFNDERDRTESRLQALSDPRKAIAKGTEKKSEAISKALEMASPTLAKPLTPKTEAEMGKLRQTLTEAGFRSESAPLSFLALRVTCSLVFLALGGGISLFSYGITTTAGIRTFVIGAIGFYLPILGLAFLQKRRKQQVFLGLPDALDLMVVCVEAGLGLDQAMRKVASEMQKSYRVIADEFSLCNLQLQMGRVRNQVLVDLGARTGVDELRALANILIQADKFGSSIANALRVQSDAMRVRRQQIAEEKAAKTAVKMIFPLVLFIFPGIFVVLVGPAGLQMAREMLPMMEGK